MSKRRIYYQHLHFKGSKQALSWETVSWYSCQKKYAHSCARRHSYTNMLVTHSGSCTYFHSLPFPIHSVSSYPSLNSHIFCHSSFPSIKTEPWLFWATLFLLLLLSSTRTSVFSFFFCLSTLILTDFPSLWSYRVISLWTKVLITSLSSYIMVFFLS